MLVLTAQVQGRNEARVWDQGSKGRDQGSERWNLGFAALGSGTTEHGIGISSLLGIRLYRICGIRDEN